MSVTPERDKRPPTTDALRDAIDKGRTGDKVAWSDPAAAPLGTDDEAAGETPGAVERGMENNALPDAGPRNARRKGALTYVVVAFALLCAFALVVWLA